MTQRILTRHQRYRLRQQWLHTQDASLCRRSLAILELDQGKAVAEVAHEFGVTRQTVYNWLDTYAESYTPSALVDAARPGRPSTWTPDLRDLLQTLLGESPTRWGYQAVNWTVPLLRRQLATWDGRWLSEDTLRRELHELGYVWKRTRYVLPPDPEREKKNAPPSAA